MVNISPVKAKAAASTVLIPAGIALGAILLGIGIAGASDSGSEVIDDVITSAQTFLEDTTSWITDGMVTAYLTGDNTKPYAFPVSLIEALFGWMFDSGTLVDNSAEFSTSTRTGNFAYSTKSYSMDVPFVPLSFYCYNGSSYDYYLVLCTQSFVGYYIVDGSTISSTPDVSSNGLYYWCVNSWGGMTPDNYYSGVTGWHDLGYVGDYSDWKTYCRNLTIENLQGKVSASKDLTLGEVASAGSTFADGYATWNEGAITIPEAEIDDGPVVVVPTGIATVPNAGQELTQADVWSGLGTYVDTGGDLDPGGSDDTQTSGDLFTDVTVTTFLAKLLADLTRALFGESTMTLTELFGSVMTEIQLLGKTFIEEIAKLLEGLQTSFQTLTDSISQIWDKAVTALLDGIKAIFVPSEDYMTAKVDVLRSKFPFIDSVISTGEFIRDSVSGASGPPAIYVDLSLASSGNYGSQKVLLTDFGWYAQYKPKVDTILSAALWAFFGWRVFLKLPGIISGESGYIGEVIAPREKTARDETIRKIMSGPPSKK